MWVKWEAYLKVPDTMEFRDQFIHALAQGLMNAGVQCVDDMKVYRVQGD